MPVILTLTKLCSQIRAPGGLLPADFACCSTWPIITKQGQNRCLSLAGRGSHGKNLPRRAGARPPGGRRAGLRRLVLDSGGHVEIPAIPAPKHNFNSVIDAVDLSLSWEKEVTEQINRLMDSAVKENDFLTQNFLGWFLTEQVEEIATMKTLLKVARRAGPNVLLLEDFVAREGAKIRGGGAEAAAE